MWCVCGVCVCVCVGVCVCVHACMHMHDCTHMFVFKMLLAFCHDSIAIAQMFNLFFTVHHNTNFLVNIHVHG